MKTRHSKDKQAQELLARAAVFRLLARGFAYPAEDHVRAMNQAFARLYESGRFTGFSPRLALSLTRAQRAWRCTDDENAKKEYVRLFLGSGPVSLHETAYGDGRRIAGRPVELADIGGFYAAFGFALSESDPDLPDHLCAELEFYSLLLVKEAYALSRGWLPKAHIAREATKTFLEQHLGRWIGALKSSLQEHIAVPYLDQVNAVETIVEAECKRRRAQPAPFTGRLPPDVMQEESFACPRETAAAH
ncbi:MAG: molecular chaperone TorD family protein [Gammaproteobacteria bacterium]|nr:molecular chaperone TorD family protein [Gammaproteobacteria bacterium]